MIKVMINIEILKAYSTFFFMILHLCFIPFQEIFFFIMNYLIVIFYLSHFFYKTHLFSLNLLGYIIILVQCIHLSLMCKFMYPLYFFLVLEFTFFFNSSHFYLENFSNYFIKNNANECIICYDDFYILKECPQCHCNVCKVCSAKIYKCPICRIFY